MVGDHVPDPPTLVVDHGLHRGAKVGLALLVGEGLGDGDEGVDSKEADRVLVVLGEFPERGEQVGEEDVMVELLGEGTELLGGRAADHGGVVGAEGGKHAAEFVPGGGGRDRVRGGVEGGGGGAGGEPLASGEALEEGEVVLVDLGLGEMLAHARDALGRLLPHERLLNRGEALEREEDRVGVGVAADVLDKALPELLREREENLVVVVERVVQERQQLVPGPFGAERERDGRDAVDGVQSEGDVFRPQLVHYHPRPLESAQSTLSPSIDWPRTKDRDGVQGRVCRVGSSGRRGLHRNGRGQTRGRR